MTRVAAAVGFVLMMMTGGIHAGRTTMLDAKTFGLVIFEASSGEEAKRIMESDRAVTDGIMTAEVFPYTIVLRRTER